MRHFISILRMGRNGKLMNCLFLEFSLECFQSVIDYWYVKLWQVQRRRRGNCHNGTSRAKSVSHVTCEVPSVCDSADKIYPKACMAVEVVHFMGQTHWATRCPDICSNIILNVLNEIFMKPLQEPGNSSKF